MEHSANRVAEELISPAAPLLGGPLDEQGDGPGPVSGLRAGAVVFLGIAVANVGNGLYHLIAGRVLGPGRYGELASLLTIVGLVAYPVAALQLTIARDVAHFQVRRDPAAITSLYRRMSFGGLAFGVVLAFGLAMAMLAAKQALGLGSTAAILVAAAGALPATFAPIVAGLAQGLERFGLFSIAQFLGPFLRIALLVPFLVIGVGVGGAMAATTLSSALVVIFVMVVLREWLSPLKTATARAAPILRPLGPALVGVLAFTSLTTIDVVVVKLWLSGHDAGIYGAASFLGRLVLYLPSSIAAVVLPKVSSRTAAGRASGDILLRSSIVTAAMCLVCTGVFAIMSRQVLNVAFGAGYNQGAPLLWRFGIAMTGFALLNLVFVYDLARHGWRAAILLAAGGVAQLATFSVVHGSGRQIVAVDIVSAYLLLGLAVFMLHGRGIVRRRKPVQGSNP